MSIEDDIKKIDQNRLVVYNDIQKENIIDKLKLTFGLNNISDDQYGVLNNLIIDVSNKRKESGGASWLTLFTDACDRNKVKYVTEALNRKLDLVIPPASFWQASSSMLCMDCRKKNNLPLKHTKKHLPIPINMSMLDITCVNCKILNKWRDKFNSEWASIYSNSIAISCKRKVRERYVQIIHDKNTILANTGVCGPLFFITADDGLSKKVLLDLKNNNIMIVCYKDIACDYNNKVLNSALDIETFLLKIGVK